MQARHVTQGEHDGVKENGWRITVLLEEPARPQEGCHAVLDFRESLRTPGLVDGFHLVHSNHELLNSKGVRQQRVFAGLA